MLHSPKFTMERRNLNQPLGKSLNPKNIIARMLRFAYGFARKRKNKELVVEES